MKRTKQDITFSELVRERSAWHCEVCGKYFPEGHRQGLDTSHYYSRAKAATRLHPDNAAAMCRGCHQHMGDNPLLFAEWIERHLGARMGYIRLLSNTIVKKTKGYKELEYQHLKRELARMKQLRRDGETGRISFDSYED